jgi:hypothetical protein
VPHGPAETLTKATCTSTVLYLNSVHVQVQVPTYLK